MSIRSLNFTQKPITCVRVYDPSRQELIGVYPNYVKAAHQLGLTPKAVRGRCGTLRRVFAPRLGMEVALRLRKLTEEDRKWIDQV